MMTADDRPPQSASTPNPVTVPIDINAQPPRRIRLCLVRGLNRQHRRPGTVAILDRIRAAKCDDEIAGLMAQGQGLTHVSPATKRKWQRAALKRQSELMRGATA